MENQEITLKFPVDRVNVILSALAELPFRVSAEVIADIRQQADGQVQEAPASDAPAPAPTPVAE